MVCHQEERIKDRRYFRRKFVLALCAGFLGTFEARNAKWVDIVFVYRDLEWGIGVDFVDDLNFSGPAFGAVFRF